MPHAPLNVVFEIIDEGEHQPFVRLAGALLKQSAEDEGLTRAGAGYD